MKPKSFRLLSALLLAGAMALLAAGCSKTTLSPTGAYQGDTFLYEADQTLLFDKAALDTFVSWEYQNRATITNQWPQVTVAADKVRAEAPQWFALAGIARASYVSIRQATGGLTNSPALNAAASNLTSQISYIGGQVTNAQATASQTTLSNVPNLLTK
jgi:hypothetical protein